MSVILAKTALQLGSKALGLNLPNISLGIGDNGKKKAKDKIKAQMIDMGVSSSSIRGFSWRNANAGKELLNFLKNNPTTVSLYNTNPIGDIGGNSVKQWIAWARENMDYSGRDNGSQNNKKATVGGVVDGVGGLVGGAVSGSNNTKLGIGVIVLTFLGFLIYKRK